MRGQKPESFMHFQPFWRWNRRMAISPIVRFATAGFVQLGNEGILFEQRYCRSSNARRQNTGRFSSPLPECNRKECWVCASIEYISLSRFAKIDSMGSGVGSPWNTRQRNTRQIARITNSIGLEFQPPQMQLPDGLGPRNKMMRQFI